MSSSFAVAAPSPLPVVLLPSAAQPATGTQAASQSAKNSADTPSTGASFANLVDELIQEITQQTGAATTPAQVRIPIKVRTSAPAAPEAAAAPKQPKLQGDDITTLMATTPGAVPPTPTPLTLVKLPTDAPGEAKAATAKPPATQGAAPEILQLTPDDTVLQVRLRASQAEVPAVVAEEVREAPVSKTPPQQNNPALSGKPINAPDAPIPGDDPAGDAGDDARQTGSQPDTQQRESKHASQRSGTPERAEASKAGSAQSMFPAVPAMHSMIAPSVNTVEKQVTPPAPTPTAVPAARAAAPEPEPPAAQQQVRSVALEFTPDGGRDVRLRVVDRGGEVHVTLHSNDVNLTGKLRDGVHDLAGSLTNAGYDGEAWTPRDNARQQQQQEESPSPPRRGKSRSGGSNEEFAGLFSNPAQETK